ncbi:MAG: glycosyltransferase family 39 protein [Anaerolineae bacterium]
MAHPWLRRLILAALVLLAFAVRAYQLHTPTLAWDEGWSVAVSQLPLGDLLNITAYDVHPPGYYLLLRLGLTLGRPEYAIRYLSLIAGVVAVPLAYQAGRVWVRRGPHADLVGLLAAAYVALAPLLIYYSQVARMYALCVVGVLLAVWGLLDSLDGTRPARPVALVGWVVGALLALYSFYYSALALAALVLYAVFAGWPLTRSDAGRRALRRVTLASVAIVALYLPWALYAVGPVLQRVATHENDALTLAEMQRLLPMAVYSVIFAYDAGWFVVWSIAAVVAAGLIVSLTRRAAPDLSPRHLLLPGLAFGFTVGGVLVGTQAHMFAGRYLIAASPFIALAVAFAVTALSARARWLGAAAIVLIAVTTIWPTWVGAVYAKGLERAGEFDPTVDVQSLRAIGARPDDLVVFNVLSLAGVYDAYRAPSDPAWTFAQRWDPVTEDMRRIGDRLSAEVTGYPRVWASLYQGTVGPNAELKSWLDRNLYPAGGAWRNETLFALYLPEAGPRVEAAPGVTWPAGPQLDSATYTAAAKPGGNVTIDLKWRAARPMDKNYVVFAHLYDEAGRLVAQHDSQPQGGGRPTSGWSTTRSIPDFHGLMLPRDVAGQLSLRVGLYDPATGERLRLDDGRDMVDVGTVEVKP